MLNKKAAQSCFARDLRLALILNEFGRPFWPSAVTQVVNADKGAVDVASLHSRIVKAGRHDITKASEARPEFI